jgi:hypothetical protein
MDDESGVRAFELAEEALAGKSVCSFLTACYFACDFDRAATWVDVLRRRGLLGHAAGVPILVGNHCDAVQATLLCELGLWGEAERVLTRAIDEFERTMGIPSWHPAIALAELLRNPGAERHTLDLVDGVEGVSAEGIDRRRLGDAGRMLDGRARTAYRRRIEDLRTEVDEALEVGVVERAEALQEELDGLVAELARAFGLGGRERAASSAAEKARLNVTRALRTAVGRVQALAPEAGGVLDRGLRTGVYCAFDPNPTNPFIGSFIPN